MSNPPLITSQDIHELGGTTRPFKSGLLHTVDLSTVATQINDQWLENLQGQSKLVELNLRGTAITDEAIAIIKTLRTLETLDLSQTDITDKALETLQMMPQLKVLALTATRVSQEKVRQIRATMIRTRIIFTD